MPATTLAAISAAFHDSFMQAVNEDRAERWQTPAAADIAPELTPLESLLANLALGDPRAIVRDAARAAYDDPDGDGIVTLAQALAESAVGVVLQALIMERYNAGL